MTHLQRCGGGSRQKKTMLDAVEKDMSERFGGQPVYIQAAYTSSKEEAQMWKEEIKSVIIKNRARGSGQIII